MDHVDQCLTPDRSSRDHPTKTMFVIGDGHVGVLMPSLVLAVRGRFQVRHVRSDSLGVFPHRHVSMTNGARFIDLYKHLLTTLRKQMTIGDVLVVSMYAGNWASDVGAIGLIGGSGGNTSGSVEDIDSTAVQMLEHDLLQGVVEPSHGKLFIFGEWPYYGASQGQATSLLGKVSSLLGFSPGTALISDADVTHQAELQRLLEPLLAHHPALHYVPLLPLFCDLGTELDNNWTTAPKGSCRQTIPGTSIQAYSDDSHVNTVGSIYMWPHVCDAMEAA
jgi:hypothetical protein